MACLPARLSLAAAAVLLAASLATGGARARVDLEGATIVVPAEAHPAERHAAEELRRFAERATGAALSIRREAPESGARFFVGPSAAMRASPAGFDTARMAREAVRVRARRGAVAVAGGSPRGTLYAAYGLIERGLGVRFLTPQHTHVPERGTELRLRRDRRHEPPFRFRLIYDAGVRGHPAFAARRRVNAVPRAARYGGRTRYRHVNHSFARLVPWRKHGAKHPEYFALHDGARPTGVKRHQTYELQLCPTEPAVRRIIVDKVLAQLEKHPDRRVVSVSQSDNTRYCRCSDCRRVNEAAGSPMGAQLQLVNAVAEAVAEKHPDVLVGTLAYQYTREPPKGIAPRDNVLIQLCSIEACQIHPLGARDCPPNAAFRRDLRAWAKRAKQLGIWHYTVNFSDFTAPGPNPWALGPDVKRFAQRGAVTAFMQGGAQGAALAPLRNYLIARMLWDPSRDPRSVIAAFLARHYGAAAPAVRGLLTTIRRLSRESGNHPDCFAPVGAYGLDDPAVVRAAERAVKRGRSLAKSAAVKRRLERIALIRDRLRLQPAARHVRGLGLDSPFEPLPVERAKPLRPRLERFLRRARALGVEHVAEGVSLEQARRIGRSALGVADAPATLRAVFAE